MLPALSPVSTRQTARVLPVMEASSPASASISAQRILDRHQSPSTRPPHRSRARRSAGGSAAFAFYAAAAWIRPSRTIRCDEPPRKAATPQTGRAVISSSHQLLQRRAGSFGAADQRYVALCLPRISSAVQGPHVVWPELRVDEVECG
jgi:hypothetical protein